MSSKLLTKYPVLVVGLLILYIAVTDMNRRGIFTSSNEKLNPSSCRSALVMLEKRAPDNWKLSCDKNSMTAVIPSLVDPKTYEGKRRTEAYYRDLANQIYFISKNSLNESLERTDFIIIHYKGIDRQINALTKGEDIAKFAQFETIDFILDHFQRTVEVQEVKKDAGGSATIE